MARFFDIIPRLNRRQLDRDLRRLQNEQHNINVNANVNGSGHVGDLNNNLNNLNHTGRNSDRIFSDLRIKMGAYLAIIRGVTAAVKGSTQTIKTYDSYITDLANAMGESREEAEKYLITLNKQGKELKATTEEMAEGADSFQRQGKTMSETETLIKNSMILSKVAKMSSADSTDALTAAMNSFNISAKDTISIIDQLTSVDLVSASSADGLAVSLGKSAGAANLAGVSISKLISMLAVMKEAAPMESDESVGNAMKSILSRMNQVKAGKFVDEDTGESLNNVETVLNKVGITTRNVNNQFLESEKILDEVGQKWSSFDGITQRAISTAIAGSYQYSRFINLMEGYNKVLKYNEVAQNSSGQAMAKFANYEESLEAKTKLLQNSLESLAYDTFGNEFYGSVLDATTVLVQFAEKTQAVKNGLTMLGIAGGAKLFTAISTSIVGTVKTLSNFSNALSILKGGNVATSFSTLLRCTEGLNSSQLKLIISSQALNTQQRVAILTRVGMTEQEISATLATLNLSNAQMAATGTTATLSGAVKGLGSSLKALAVANPVMTALTAMGMAVYGAVKAYDYLTVSAEEAKEAMEDAVSAYESAKTEIENINSQLESNGKRIDELNSKDKLTYAEKGELEELKQITAELELQRDIQERKAEKTQRESAENAVDYYEKNFGKQDVSKDSVEKAYNEISETGFTSQGSISREIALLEKAKDDFNRTNNELSNTDLTENEKEGLQKQAQTLKQEISDAESILDDSLEKLVEQRSTMSNEYNSILKKQENGEFLTSVDKNIISSYEEIGDIIRSIYEYTDPNTWNDMQIGQIFSTKGIEKTKEELVEMAKSGELTADSLKEYPNLNRAIKDSEIFLMGAKNEAEAFCNEINALVDESGKIESSFEPSSLSLDEMITEINDKVKPALDSLKDAYQNIFEIDSETGKELFSLDDFDISSIKSLKEELSEIGIGIDSTYFTDFINTLTDSSSTADQVHDQFNLLTSAIINVTDCTNMSGETFDILVSSLEGLGVTNAEDILIHLATAQKECSDAGKDLETITGEEIAELIELGRISNETVEFLRTYQIQKQLASQPLNTLQDVLGLESVCNALGVTGKLYEYVIDLKRAFAAKETLPDSATAGIDASIESIKEKIRELSNGKGGYDFNFDGIDDSKKSKSSGSSKDAWLEEYKKKLNILKDQLDQQLITERDFYDKSETLMNEYLKNSPAHIKKYAEEISGAEKELHDAWNNAYESEKSALEDQKDGGMQTPTYLRELTQLAQEYYDVFSQDVNLKSLEELPQALQEQVKAFQELDAETNDINKAYEELAENAKDCGYNIAEYIGDGADTVQKYGKYTKEAKDAAKELKQAYKDYITNGTDELQNAYSSLIDICDTYNEHGKITVDQYQELTDMGFQYIAQLSDETGELKLNEQAFEELAQIKVQEMQIQMARNAIDVINGLQSETAATEYLANANAELRDNALSATEALLQQAVASAKLRGEQQGLAAEQIAGAYKSVKDISASVSLAFDPSKNKDNTLDLFNAEKRQLEHLEKMGEINRKEYYERLMKLAQKYFGGNEKYKENLWDVEEEYRDYFESIKESYNWIDKLLDKLSKTTNKFIDSIEKFASWQKKNNMINRAVKATDNEIDQNQNAYWYYMQKANSVGLDRKYINKIQNGELNIEELADEELSEKIEKYQEWYDKAQDVADKINDLYEQERDLIRQKLDNVLDYYRDLDSYLSSITSKMESFVSLSESMGKRSSLTDLVKQFADLSNQISSASTSSTVTTTLNKVVTEIDFGESDLVNEAVKRDKQELTDAIQAEIDNLDVEQSGTYTKLLKDIEKKEAQIAKYEEKGWDTKKAKQYEKLKLQLQNYYDLQSELDNYATSNTIANYSKIYTEWQKLQNKIDSGKDLSKGEQKRYDKYLEQMEALQNEKDTVLNELEAELAKVNGTVTPDSEVTIIREKISAVSTDLEDTATYQNLIRNIETTEQKLAELETIGYDNLTKKQKKTYDNLTKTLEAYYAKREAFDEGATAANIAEYDKIYTAWRKLQDKLDKGGNLSNSQWKQYNKYTQQLEDFANGKSETLEELNDQLNNLLNPTDKVGTIEREYENAAEGIYESYQKQMDDINNDVTSTTQYQNLLAKAQKLEQKKDTKGLSKSEEATLKKYNEELEALRKGGSSQNITDYMKTWEAFYKLQQKLDDKGKLSDADAKKYDTYKAQLEAWNEAKQTQLNDLADLMQEELDALSKANTESIAEAEAEINEYYANLYDLAKQIAEYNITSLESQLSVLESFISYYEQIISLYDSFSGDKLQKLLSDLDMGNIKDQSEAYEKYLSTLEDRYKVTLDKIKEYNQLIEAIDTNDFEGSMDLFSDAVKGYRESGNTAMADKLQKVLDLLNERSVDADNWDSYADEWLNEWTQALNEAKGELIETSNSIQEVNDSMREFKLSGITDSIEELEQTKEILSSIAGLINDEFLYEADGSLSEFGRAKAGLLVSELENAQVQANKYLDLYNEIANNKDTFASDKAYESALNEALGNYYSSLGEVSSIHNEITSLMKKQAEEEINALEDVINARKEALQAKKSYYDYDKTIKDKNKNLQSLKAELAALNDINTAEAKARKAQLESELADAEEDLADTKLEHEFDLQINALDEFSETLKETLEDTTKSVAEIMKEQAELVESAKDIYADSSSSLQDSVDKLISFYGGMGMSIDGLDIEPVNSTTPVESVIPETENYVPVSLADQLKHACNDEDKFKAFLLANDFSVVNKDMIDYRPVFSPVLEQMNSTTRAILANAEKRQTGGDINLHYDSLITVNGNVDKNFMPDMKKFIVEACEYTKKDLYKEVKRLGMVR